MKVDRLPASSVGRAPLAAAAIALCCVHPVAALAGEAQELTKPFVEKLLRGSEKDAAPAIERSWPKLGPQQLRRAFMDNRGYLLSLVKAFAPEDWSPYLDAISGALDDIEGAAKEAKAWERLDTPPPDPEIESVLSSTQFRQVASEYYWRHCRGYSVTFPPDRLPKAILAEIELLEANLSDEEKTCRTIALVALSSRPLLTQLARFAR